MNTWLVKHIGVSWKTTLISYILAAMVAVQPFLTEDVDLSNRAQLIRYIIRLLFAAGVAVFGKIAADSSQVKTVDRKVEQLKDNA